METVLILCSLLAPAVLATGKRPPGLAVPDWQAWPLLVEGSGLFKH